MLPTQNCGKSAILPSNIQVGLQYKCEACDYKQWSNLASLRSSEWQLVCPSCFRDINIEPIKDIKILFQEKESQSKGETKELLPESKNEDKGLAEIDGKLGRVYSLLQAQGYKVKDIRQAVNGIELGGTIEEVIKRVLSKL